MKEIYEKRRNKLFEACQACSLVTPMLPHGAFYIFAKINDKSVKSWDMTARLLEEGIGSTPGDVFGPRGKGHIRFSFSCDDKNIEIASEVLSEL